MVLNYWHHQSIVQLTALKLKMAIFAIHLLAIKNVGYAGYQAIDARAEKMVLFKDVFDFVSRMESSKLK